MPTNRLRASIAGLIRFAEAEEEILWLEAAGTDEQGSPECWGALPTIAHNSDFKAQQVIRLSAVPRHEVPPGFGETDHRSPDVYADYVGRAAHSVLTANRDASDGLVDGLSAVSDDDLLNPALNPWLGGRLLWLQVVVRGFWHPTGHVGDYYFNHGNPTGAIALHTQAVATARRLGVPDPALGMAVYSLACANARLGQDGQASRGIDEAITLNPDLREHAARDDDLKALRRLGAIRSLAHPATSAPG